MSPLEQFLVIAITHLIAVASPGPDFAIILKQSIRYNRRIAIYTSLGIAAGIIVHVIYSLVGIGLLIASDERLFTLLKYIAASYFVYVAWHCFYVHKVEEVVTASSVTPNENRASERVNPIQGEIPSIKKAFLTGFLINALNVKATLFFVSLFSLVIVPDTALSLKIAYGVYLTLATGAWFCFISYMLTHQRIRHLLQCKSYIIDRIMGIILLLLAAQLVFSNIH